MKRLWVAVLAGLILLCAGLGARHLILSLSHSGPLEYGEGVNLLWARRAAAGAPLYPSITPESLPWIHNPYPPAYTWAAGHLASGWTGFTAGRFLSLLSMVGSAVCLYSLASGTRVLHRGVRWLAPLLFLLSPLTLRMGGLMRVDMTALFFSLLAVSLGRSTRSTFRLIAAGLAAGLAVCIKPTFLAAALWLLWSQRGPHVRQRWAVLIASGAIAPLAFAGWLFSREEPQLILHLWTLQTLPADLSGALSWLGTFANQHALVLAAGLAAIAASSRVPDDLKAYGRLSIIAPALTFHISGAGAAYLLEVWAVCCLTLPFLFTHAIQRHRSAALSFLILQLVLFIPVPSPPVFTRTYGQEVGAGSSISMTPTREDADVFAIVMAECTTDPGPVLSSSPGIALLSGHDVQMQPFQFGHLAASGQWDETRLVEKIETLSFSVIVLKGDAAAGADPYFTPAAQKRIASQYRLHRVAGPWHIYRR